MKRQSPSIFNDIVGPTMIGPSSSHTCAPSRIGFLSQQILQGKLKKATIAFAREGAYTLMYQGQRSDYGYINGLLGRRPEDPRLCNAYSEAKKAGIEVKFVIEDFTPIVPNISHLTLESTTGEKVIIHSDSTGGGTVKLLKIDDFPVSITGDCYELLIRTNGTEDENNSLCETIRKQVQHDEGASVATIEHKGLINIKFRTVCSEDFLSSVRTLPNVISVNQIEPILVVPSNWHCTLPFKSAANLLELAEKNNKELWELAIDYEMARSGWNRQEVLDYMQYVVETMENSSREALKGDIDMAGIIKPTAGKIQDYIKSNKSALDMGVMNFAVPWSMATMEYSSSMGLVLCAPTGGSAGVFPGAVLGVANYLGLSMDKKIKAMLTTAIIGIVMSKDCNYSAELYGCQVEPGAASGMAAGGLVYLMGGTAKQTCQAASCAVQNILGTICDPVAGLVQVPCISRNAMSAANAIVSANMIMGGYDPLIPLDEVAETLFRVGKQLPSELRCTCRGGLCITPSGQELAKKQLERDIAKTQQ